MTQYQQFKRDILFIQQKELEYLRSQNAYSDALIQQKELELALEQMAVEQTT